MPAMTLLLGLLTMDLWRFVLPQTSPAVSGRLLIPASRANHGPYPLRQTLVRLIHAPTPHLLS
jgi:hypothetical protein